MTGCQPVLSTVATEGRGADELWSEIGRHRRHLVETGELERRRSRRIRTELRAVLRHLVDERIDLAGRSDAAAEVLGRLDRRDLDVHDAADRLLALAGLRPGAGPGAQRAESVDRGLRTAPS